MWCWQPDEYLEDDNKNSVDNTMVGMVETGETQSIPQTRNILERLNNCKSYAFSS